MSRYRERAVEYFEQGYNCSQSVVAPFAEQLGLDLNTALRFSVGFGGGIGRLREVCGAFCGIAAVIGLKYSDPANPEDKSNIYAILQQLSEQYKQRIGRDTLLCRDLLANSAPTPGSQAEPRTAAYYERRPCPELVRQAAELLAEYIEQNP